jgi:hypothetical protein
MLEKNEDNIKACMFKQGTMLWKSVKTGTNTIKKFDTAEQCADSINTMYGIEGLSGRELQTAVKEGRVGVSPPPRGRPSKILTEDFKLFAQLFFTLSAIEQSNADPQRLTRPKLVSLAGTIVNEKLISDGSAEMSDIRFYERIQKENSDKQGVVVTDPRDALRVKWLTYRNQLNNHENWEDECVRLGFARMPLDDRERDEKGHIVFFEGQERRFCNLDEMPFALDGAEATAGGRPAVTPSIDIVAEAGQTSDKTSQKCTVVFGIIGDEPIPPLLIFPSGAKTAERMKIDSKKLLSFQQVHAQYGFDSKMYHDVTVAMSGKGGMNAVIFENWITEHVMPLWPDLEDVPGKRVMLKTDMGPGRSQTGFLSRTYVEGMGVFPGLPNGTGCGQEMDQIFRAFKICCYRNRMRLYNARHALDENATITLLDSGYIIFGGSVLLKDGSYIELEPAFSLYLSPAHIKAAREKCGYCPATRNALNSSQIRHEVVAGEEDDIEEDSDPHGALLDQLEKENHFCVSQLEERGYSLAFQAKRFVKRITSNQLAGQATTRTVPNTRERQDLLQKVSTSGQFYQVTSGGAVLNSADVLLGRERKLMLKEAKTLQDLKKETLAFADTLKSAKLLGEKDYKKWTMRDFKVAIQYKAGKPMTFSGLKAADLKTLYRDKYKGKKRQKPRDGGSWTAENEGRLEDCLSGEIDDILESTIYGRALDTQNTYLSTRLLSMSKTRRKDVLAKVLEELTDDEKIEIGLMLSGGPNSVLLLEEEEEEEGSENVEEGSDDESAVFGLESEDKLDSSNYDGNGFDLFQDKEYYSDKESLEDGGKGKLCMVVSLIIFNYFDGQQLTICLLKTDDNNSSKSDDASSSADDFPSELDGVESEDELDSSNDDGNDFDRAQDKHHGDKETLEAVGKGKLCMVVSTYI